MSEKHEILEGALAGIRKTAVELDKDLADNKFNNKFTAFEATRLSLELTNQTLAVHKIFQLTRIADALEKCLDPETMYKITNPLFMAESNIDKTKGE